MAVHSKSQKIFSFLLDQVYIPLTIYVFQLYSSIKQYKHTNWLLFLYPLYIRMLHNLYLPLIILILLYICWQHSLLFIYYAFHFQSLIILHSDLNHQNHFHHKFLHVFLEAHHLQLRIQSTFSFLMHCKLNQIK